MPILDMLSSVTVGIALRTREENAPTQADTIEDTVASVRDSAHLAHR